MDDEAAFSALIADIYDCVLDHSKWTGALRAIAGFVGGPSAALFHKNAATKSGGVFHEYGVEPEFRDLYFDRYVGLDPTTPAHVLADIGEPFSTESVMPYDEFRKTRFYTEWVRPQGVVDAVNVVLDKSSASACMFVVFRHRPDDLVDRDARTRTRLIMPHVRRAALVGRAIGFKKMEASKLAQTLDSLRAGAFLVDPLERLVHANVAGHVMLAEDDVLGVADGRLASPDPAFLTTLRQVVAAAAAREAAAGAAGIATPLRGRSGAHYVARLLPLSSGERRDIASVSDATVVVFVHKAAFEGPHPAEVIAKAYRLTPTELRVMLAVAQIGGVPDVAEALGIADSTVRTHLVRLFEKTGATRQADLVRIVAGFATPFAK